MVFTVLSLKQGIQFRYLPSWTECLFAPGKPLKGCEGWLYWCLHFNTKLSFFFQKNWWQLKNYFCCIYGTKWFGVWLRQDQGLKASRWNTSTPKLPLRVPPGTMYMWRYFTYFASIEVGLYFHTGALSNLLANITHYGSCQLICPNILDCARYSGRINSSTFCSQVFLPL